MGFAVGLITEGLLDRLAHSVGFLHDTSIPATSRRSPESNRIAADASRACQGKILTLDNMEQDPIVGTRGSQRYQLEMDVPAEAARVTFGVLLVAPATTYIDHFQFEALDDAGDPNRSVTLLLVGSGVVGGVMNIDINELRTFMEDIAAERGDFTLFGLFLRDEAPDKWDLVVSAPWLEEGKLKALGEFAKKLSAAIGEDKVLSLSRIVTLNADDPALDAIVRHLRVSGAPVELRDTDVFGLKFKRAYILQAKRPQPAPSSAT